MPLPFGLNNPLNLLVYAGSAIAAGAPGGLYEFDVTNFNDANVGSSYSWKVEDILAGRTPTCIRVILTVRDLGVATITLTLSGVDQNKQAPVSVSTALSIGTVGATNALITYLPGLSLTAQNLQLSITRAPNAGPVSIVKVRLEGKVETTAYA